jgi:HK97 family phage portal protein
VSWFARVARPRAAIDSSHELAKALRSGYETGSGAIVTPDTALQVPEVFAAVRVIAETVAAAPLVLYRKTAGGRERAEDHPLYSLLHDQPNPWQTSYEWRESMVAHQVLCGGAFSIKTVVRGELRELLPVVPQRVKVKQLEPSKRLVYDVEMPDGQTLTVPQERMFHVPGLSWDTLAGLTPYWYQREAIGLAVQLREFAARLFRNGAALRLVMTHPQVMSDEAYARLSASFNEQFAGASNAHKALLVEEGVKVEKVSSTAEDAQMLESRRYSKNEVATFNRLPPHLLGDLDRATHSNIEQQSLEFIIYTMQAHFARWEQRIRMSLIPDADRPTHYAEFLLDSLLRGDTITRYQAYQYAISNGWMTRNEVRAKENLNAGPPELDAFLQPAFLAGKPSADGSAAPGDPASKAALALVTGGR